MSGIDLVALARAQKPVRGQRLSAWLQRFLAADADQLARWQGNFTEVTTAKVVEIYRRRGLLEEPEAQQERFAELVNACYRLQPYRPEAVQEESEGQNPS